MNPPASNPPEPEEMSPAFNDIVYGNIMSHFYRGELGRIMIWRQRLDVTTNWAITSTTTILTVAFSFRDVPHVIFFFSLIVVSMMLWIEARRYRFYDAYRARVRMLEAHFIMPVVMQNRDLLEGEWRKLVSQDLLVPAYKITRLEAVARRLKRNYALLYAVTLIAWVTKIILHAPPGNPIESVADFYDLMAVGRLPSWAVASSFILTVAAIIGMLIWLARRDDSEVQEFGERDRARWKI